MTVVEICGGNEMKKRVKTFGLIRNLGLLQYRVSFRNEYQD